MIHAVGMDCIIGLIDINHVVTMIYSRDFCID